MAGENEGAKRPLAAKKGRGKLVRSPRPSAASKLEGDACAYLRPSHSSSKLLRPPKKKSGSRRSSCSLASAQSTASTVASRTVHPTTCGGGLSSDEAAGSDCARGSASAALQAELALNRGEPSPPSASETGASRQIVEFGGQATSGHALEKRCRAKSKKSPAASTRTAMSSSAERDCGASADLPNKAYTLGCDIITVGTVLLRQGEDLTSPEVCELPAGQRCVVESHGTGAGGKRLFVTVPNAEVQGWISCVSQSGLALIKLTEQLAADAKPEAIAQDVSVPLAEASPESIVDVDEPGTTATTGKAGSGLDGELLQGGRRVDPSDYGILTFGEFHAKYSPLLTRDEICVLWERATPVNDSGLPLRPNERFCKAYATNRTCKFGVRCRYDHSDMREPGKDGMVGHRRSRSVPNRLRAECPWQKGPEPCPGQRRIVHRVCVQSMDIRDLGWTATRIPAERVYIQDVMFPSWASTEGLRKGDEVLDVGGLSPDNYPTFGAFQRALQKRPLWLAFACMREDGEMLGPSRPHTEARSGAEERSRSAQPGEKHITAVATLFQGIKNTLWLAKGSSQEWLRELMNGVADGYHTSKDLLCQELVAALAREDNTRVNQLVDGAMGGCMFGKNTPDIISRTAKTLASRQLRECVESGDPKRIKGALLAAKRLNASDVPEFVMAVAKYKDVKRLPANWDVGKMLANRRGARMIAKSRVTDSRILDQFQQLLDSTHRKVYTRDRRGEAVPERLVVTSVTEVANDSTWVDYMARQEEIRREFKCKETDRIVINTDTAGWEARDSSDNCLLDPPLDPAVNEVLLFHGTNPVASESITTQNFKIDLAGSNAGTLYGRGVYMAENGSKSDEYTRKDASGQRTLLVCRVTLGRPYITDLVAPDPRICEDACLKGQYHAVVGDRRKCRGTFREFVLFDEEQVYANFILTYERSPTECDK